MNLRVVSLQPALNAMRLTGDIEYREKEYTEERRLKGCVIRHTHTHTLTHTHTHTHTHTPWMMN